MSLILVGDIVYPFKESVAFNSIIDLFKNNVAVGNLEGPILLNPSGSQVYDAHKYNIYSCTAILEVLNELNFRSVSIANNHFCDFKGVSQYTLDSLTNNGIAYFGHKKDKWSVVEDHGVEYAIYGAYTSITGGNRAKECLSNSFNSKGIIQEINNYSSRYPHRILIIYIHWGYELADYPQPADREWARKAIDAGAKAVIGHHPHVIQGIEQYKEGLIAYSLGNFMMPLVNYLGKQLAYNTLKIQQEMIIELTYHNHLEYKTHLINYDPDKHFLQQEDVDSERILEELTPFRDYSNKEYREWFQAQNKPSRYPTYQSYDNILRTGINNFYVKGLKTVRKAMIMAGIHKPF
ncbi:CapA family protein [Catalinimonas niigatensis]|uniref:CapA family protein n=1 Tax=Catalinimonas niigatensis TaxID=1397264 RepID=UPI002666AA8E|nr:CapA family protein [Catalinimonas niigatensis]WPP50287.1 CapA family protein [Catalinimonas niigatensis]